MGGRAKDLTGQTYGRLTVLERIGTHVSAGGTMTALWRCLCECGGIKVTQANSLRAGYTKSCGCLQREAAATRMRATRSPTTNYRRAHVRVRTDRGVARNQTCVDCGGPAEQWSYDHADPNELTEERVMKGKARIVAYSADPTHYSPRCRPCHTRFDKGRK